MRKKDTTKWKAKSRRNRHNGRINADKANVMERGQTFQTSDGVVYHATVQKTIIDLESELERITTRIVRAVNV